MKWYYYIAGGHTHVRVFVNGAKCGDLCFRNEEFERIKTMEREHDLKGCVQTIEFILDQSR